MKVYLSAGYGILADFYHAADAPELIYDGLEIILKVEDRFAFYKREVHVLGEIPKPGWNNNRQYNSILSFIPCKNSIYTENKKFFYLCAPFGMVR